MDLISNHAYELNAMRKKSQTTLATENRWNALPRIYNVDFSVCEIHSMALEQQVPRICRTI